MRRVAVGVAAGLTIGACFIKPDAPNEARDAATADAPRKDAIDVETDGEIDAPACDLYDDFATGSGCGTWGSAQGSGSQSIVRNGGNLVMSSTTAGFSACESHVPVPFDDVIVQIVQYVTEVNGRIGVLLTFDNNLSRTFRMELTTNSGGNGTITVSVNGGTPMVQGDVGDEDHYYRFSNNGVALQLERSLDRSTWTNDVIFPLGYTPAQVQARLYVTYATTGGAQSGIFGHLDGCPP